MENHATIPADSTVRSQDSKNSSESKDSKSESCLESKHSKDILIPEKQQKQQQHRPQAARRRINDDDRRSQTPEVKDDTSILMFTSCGQLLLGVVLVVFGVLVLVHGASLGGSGAGLWAGAGALVAGALGVVATLASSSSGKPNSGFSTAHLASSLVALALSNMAAITALTAVVRDAQRNPEVTLLTLPGENDDVLDVEAGWSGLLASIGLLVASVAELLVSGYTCVTLTPKLCGCLRSNSTDEDGVDGRLKTRNMVHQWVIAQNHVPKNQPIYVVQPVMPMHPMIQPPYAMPAGPGKFPPGFVPAGTLPMPGPGYGPVPIHPAHMSYVSRPSSQMMRSKPKRPPPSESEEMTVERKRRQSEGRVDSARRMSSIGEDQVDLAQTYTGLDKKISEEFISIAMDPDRKSKASSHHGSEIGAAKTC